MSQATVFPIPNESGVLFRQHVNEMLAALQTDFAGNTAPTIPAANMTWTDTSTTPYTIKRRNSGNTAWVTTVSSFASGLLDDADAESMRATLGIGESNYIAVAGGTTDMITATFTPAITTLTQGLSVLVRASYANTSTTPTFSPNGLTAATIVKGSNAPLVAGDIAGAGHWIELQYDTTLSKWVIQNPAYGVTPNTVQASTTEITNETSVAKYVSPDRLSSSKRVAKAWVNFNGGNGAINSSHNISSVTRNGVGIYTINFTTSMTDTNYAVMLCARSSTSGYGGALCHNVDPTTAPTTASVKVNTGYQDDNSNTYTMVDPTSVYVTILGN